MTHESILLAALMGVGFAGIAHWLWHWDAGKTAAVLLLVYATTTLAQLLWRLFDGIGTIDEVVTISGNRLAMAAAAVLTAWLLHRRDAE